MNDRATALAGVDVFGDAFMMDASAHSAGAELVDITLPRYEFLKVGIPRPQARHLRSIRRDAVEGTLNLIPYITHNIPYIVSISRP